MRIFALLALCFAAVAAVPTNPQRIVGGSLTTIDQYPTIAVVLYTWNFNTFGQSCGGTIINNRAVLTAAHCTNNETPNRFQLRVGSSFAHSGGVTHFVNANIVHSGYDRNTYANDLAILRSATSFSFNNNVRAVSIAGANYNLADNQPVWAAGWGATFHLAFTRSEQLRHVEMRSINQATCRNNYSVRGTVITDYMLCSGWPTGGRDQCQGDSGGPLYHNGVLVGVCSFGAGCGQVQFPGVNVRVSRYTAWISSNA